MKQTRLFLMIPFVAVLVGFLACNESKHSDDAEFDVDAAISQCDRQVHRALAQLTVNGAIDTTMMPRNIQPGDSAWTCRPLCSEEWCSGFWPGILWLDYEAQLMQGLDIDKDLRDAALNATKAMHRVVDRPVLDHDLGFLVYCSAGTAMRVLKDELAHKDLPDEQRAEDEAAIALYRDLCLRASDSLATLFDPTVGTILSWPRNVPMFGGHNTIMDNMINLEMLCWAANETNNELLKNIAITHAETTRMNHFREDGTCYHVAVYDTLDGHFIHGVTHQGLADSSTWARGQSWAVYGFTMMARETGNKDFLAQACKAADAFIKHLPDDYVPFWDFDDPRNATSPSEPAAVSETVAPRDASAAAVVASALLELCTLVDDAPAPEGSTEDNLSSHYLSTAAHILQSLASDHYQGTPQNTAFLLHSTGSYPAASEVDIPIIYADYYYLEALLRYKRLCQNR